MMEIPEKHCWDRTYVINRFFFGHRIIYDINVMQQIDTFGHFYKTDRLSFLYGVFTVSTVVGFIPRIPQLLVYGFLVVFALYCFGKPHKTNRWLVAFLLYIPLELHIAQPDPLFKSWPRYAMFVLLLACVSPLFLGEYHRMARRRLMLILLWSCAFIGVGSFFCRFLGINYMVVKSMDVFKEVGLFGGLTIHSMLLGPISGIGAIFLSYQAMQTRRKWLWLCVVACLFSVFFSSSRIALAASLAGMAAAFYKLSGSVNKFLRMSLVAVLLAGSSFPFWSGAMDGIIEKNAGTASVINVSSREKKWDVRMMEFQGSPVFGVGFSSVNPILAEEEFDPVTGTIEPGTSWLAVFSMLGLIGAVFVLPFFYKCFRTVWQQHDAFHAIIVGVLTLLFVHMFAEGYIFSAGSFMCYILWLTLGVAYDSKCSGRCL